MKKNRMGRPPLPPDEVRSVILRVRMTEDDLHRLQAAAERADQPLSTVALAILRRHLLRPPRSSKTT